MHRAIAFCIACTLSLCIFMPSSSAVEHDMWTIDDSQADFQEGTLTNVSVSSDGNLSIPYGIWMTLNDGNDYAAIDGFYYDSNSISTMTIETRFRTPDGNDNIIASFDRNEYWRFELGGNAGGTGDVGMCYYTNSGQVDNFGSTTNCADNEWHHAAFVFDSGDASLYVDGTLENTNSYGSTIGTHVTRYGFIGVGSEATSYDGSQGPTQWFDGDISEFRIWSVARTESQIQDNMDSSVLGDSTGLEVYYKCDEGSGNTLNDAANSNDATLYGDYEWYSEEHTEGNRVSPSWNISDVGTVGDSLINWTSEEPSGTSITIETSISTDGGSTWSSWMTATDGGSIPSLSSGQDASNMLLRCRQTLQTDDPTVSPSVWYLEMYVFREGGGGGVAIEASFVYSPHNVSVGENISFYDDSYSASNLTYWLWNFGDGSGYVGQNTSYGFGSEGVYNVSLTVENEEGLRDTVTRKINVSASTEYTMAVWHMSFIVSMFSFFGALLMMWYARDVRSSRRHVVPTLLMVLSTVMWMVTAVSALSADLFAPYVLVFSMMSFVSLVIAFRLGWSIAQDVFIGRKKNRFGWKT